MRLVFVLLVAALAAGLWAAPRSGVPAGCDPSVMRDKYWEIWNADKQAKINRFLE